MCVWMLLTALYKQMPKPGDNYTLFLLLNSQIRMNSSLKITSNHNFKLACFFPNPRLLLAEMLDCLVSNLARLTVKSDLNLPISNWQRAQMSRYKSPLQLFRRDFTWAWSWKGVTELEQGHGGFCRARLWLQNSWPASERSALTASSWPTRGCEGKSSVGEARFPEPGLIAIILRKPSGPASWSNCGCDRVRSVFLSKWAKSRLLRRL